MKDSISVLKEWPETTSDAEGAQCAAPSQKSTTTRPKRADTPEPAIAETTKDWSEEEEDDNTVFAKSSVTARTPPQMCCTPPDVSMAPKKKETTLAMKLRGTNATGATTTQPSKQIDEVSPMQLPGNLIEALKKVQDILSQSVIRKEQESDA